MEVPDFMYKILMPFIFIGIVLCLLFAMVVMINYDQAQSMACEEIGMEKISIDEVSFCLDQQDNAHYVKFECESTFIWTTCKARLLSIGDLRIK